MIPRTLILLSILAVGTAQADEVTDTINEGLDLYKAGDFAAAAGSFEYAAQLSRQMKGASLAKQFPEPLKGWTAEEATSASMGAAMFGGGVSAEREYSKGNSTITIRIVSDSPMLQSVMMMFNNPMIAAASPNIKLERIAGQKVMTEFSAGGDSGTLNTVVAGSILVTFEGRGVTLDEIKAYVNAFDFKSLAATI